MAELPVDPEKRHDTFYRYKMPAVTVKVEGSGNGIKTVLPNISEIAQRIGRDVEYPMKYFGMDLGAHAKYEDSKWIIMGQHAKERLQKSLYQYICRFVLCKACRNPETKTLVDEKQNVILRCGACGKDTSIDPTEKLVKVILKKEAVTIRSRREDTGRDKERREKKKKDRTEGDSRKTVIDPGMKHPAEVLKEYLAQTPAPVDSDVVAKVRDVKTEYGLKDKEVVRLLVETLLCDKGIVASVRKHAHVLRKLVPEECHRYVVEGVELNAHEHRDMVPKLPIALWALWDEGVIEEDCIIAWHAKEKQSKYLDEKLTPEIKAMTKPLVDWLAQDEDEEDDD